MPGGASRPALLSAAIDLRSDGGLAMLAGAEALAGHANPRLHPGINRQPARRQLIATLTASPFTKTLSEEDVTDVVLRVCRAVQLTNIKVRQHDSPHHDAA